MIQNAILYVLRKKKRTCILFIILTTVLSFLYSSLNIMKLSNNLENNLYKISNTSISITQKDNQNFEINQFKEMENIQEIKEIIPQYDCLAKATNVEVQINKLSEKINPYRTAYNGKDMDKIILKLLFQSNLQIVLKIMFYLIVEFLLLLTEDILKKMIEKKYLYMKNLLKRII